MPAVPAATVILTASSTPDSSSAASAGSSATSDQGLLGAFESATATPSPRSAPDSASTADAPPAFTVLPDEDGGDGDAGDGEGASDDAPPLVCLLDGEDGAFVWQPLNAVDYSAADASAPLDASDDLCDIDGRRFRASRPDQQSVTAANLRLLQRKLMDLQEPKDKLFAPRQPPNGIVRRVNVKVNNLKEQKPHSKSSGHVCHAAPPPEKKLLRKDFSASHNNVSTPKRVKRSTDKDKDKHSDKSSPIAFSGINKNIPTHNKNILTSQNRSPPPKCNYHKNCYPTSPGYKMASTAKPIIIDTKQANGVLSMRRRSSPASDDSLSPFANNNNNTINLKNKQNEKNNRLNNDFSRSMNRLNNGGAALAASTDGTQKPLFVTTVKSGEFLDPPPELAMLLGLAPPMSRGGTGTATSPECTSSQGDGHRQQVLLYSFSSQPRVLHQHHHRARCEAAKAAKERQLQKQQLQVQATPPGTVPDGAEATSTPRRVRRDVGGGGERRTSTNSTQDKGGGSDGPPPYGNLMFDRRVVRGSTFAQHPIPTCGESQAARQLEARRRALARRRAQGQQTRHARYRLGTPPPVAGRKHEPVQTENYLEELWERPPEVDVGCQTELFLDRPESPIYLPAKTGKDAETQIYPGDLFDFDVEVVPILEVLVGKTIQQAMMEVLEEEELAALREQQRRFLELRAAEEAERHRLEEQERRLREEKEARVGEFGEASRVARQTEERVAAAVLTQGYLEDLIPSVLDGLRDSGYLIDDVREDIRGNFMPWLMNEVQQEMTIMVNSRDIIMEMVREILEQRADVYRTMADEDASKLELSDDELPSEREPVEPLMPGDVVMQGEEGGEDASAWGEASDMFSSADPDTEPAPCE